MGCLLGEAVPQNGDLAAVLAELDLQVACMLTHFSFRRVEEHQGAVL